jgi:two-component system, OmpR family, phosphate regulon response regulator OmpR
MARAPHIVVVDDEPEVRESLAEYLALQGFRISEADGAMALRAILGGNDRVDLVLLDLRMPGEDGLSLARWLREHAKVGVIMITGSSDTVDRITGLEVGADDYIAKPFDLREVLARVRSVMRRVAGMPTKPTRPNEVRFGRFIIDLAASRLTTECGDTVSLTSMEFDLLKAFVTHPNRVLSRDQLLDLAHGKASEPFDRSIDIRITRLRRKIETDAEKPHFIKTIRGAGYLFAPDESG